MSDNTLISGQFTISDWRKIAGCINGEIISITDDDDWELNNKEEVNNLKELLTKVKKYALISQ